MLDTVMTDVVGLGERKGIAKCEPRLLLSSIQKEMSLSQKELGEIIKVYCLNEQNAAPTLRIYRRNRLLRRGLCAVKALSDSTHKFLETGCTCDQLRS